MSNKKKIIIFESDFNPPHLGHAAILNTALKSFDCDEVWVLPTGDSPDKDAAEVDDRVQMTEIWAEDLFSDCAKPVVVSRMEADRGNSISAFEVNQELTGQHPDHEFYFLIGSDKLSGPHAAWRKGDASSEALNFIIVGRPGYDLPADLPGHSLVLETSGSKISGEKIRAAIEDEDGDLEDYLSEGVVEYIRENKLYQPKYD